MATYIDRFYAFSSQINCQMTTSVIIPTYNGEKKITDTLKALAVQTLSPYEVVVVIDGSVDNTEKILNTFDHGFERFHIVVQENKGRAAARNTGVKNSHGELLIFLDDDVLPDKDVLSMHHHHHIHHPDTILVGNITEQLEIADSDFRHFKSYLNKKWNGKLSDTKSQLKIPFITAANFSIRKTTFSSLGGFNESLTDAEDYELAVRAFHEKIPIFFDPDIIGRHNDPITCKKYIVRQRQYRHAQKKVAEIHGNPMTTKEGNLWKKAFFKLFSSGKWVKLIDRNRLTWLPKKIRYRIYDWVVTGLGTYNPQIKLP